MYVLGKDFSEAWKTSLWEGPMALDLTCPVLFSQSLPSHTDAVISKNQPCSGKCLLYSLQLVRAAGQAWEVPALGVAHYCLSKHLPLIPYPTTRLPLTFIIKAPHHTPVLYPSQLCSLPG